jgi:hypothetical protein
MGIVGRSTMGKSCDQTVKAEIVKALSGRKRGRIGRRIII